MFDLKYLLIIIFEYMKTVPPFVYIITAIFAFWSIRRAFFKRHPLTVPQVKEVDVVEFYSHTLGERVFVHFRLDQDYATMIDKNGNKTRVDDSNIVIYLLERVEK